MAPKLSHLLLTFLIFLSLQSSIGLARTLKSEHHPYSFSSLQKLEGVQKGQTVEGLIEVKQYLKKFGYYPSDVSLMTRDFDDLLESALKTYQNNFHLNVTGILDSSTTKQMMIPRCGLPDIINNPSSKPNSTKSKHNKFHMVAHYSFFFGKPTWPPSKYHLTYTFESGVQVVHMDTLRSACSNAFKTWADVSQFTFQEAADGASANIIIAFYSGNHGDSLPFDGAGGKILAHAFAPEDGRLHFNAEKKWSSHPKTREFDLESVAVHEIGHLLGLDHSDDSNSIMYPGVPPGTVKRDLAQDDIDGLHALYPN